jgi:hypothetical protein
MILDDITKFIAASSTAFTSGTNLFASMFPPGSADTAAVVIEYSGPGPEWAFGSTSPIRERPRVQIISRSSSYQTARTNAETIHTILDRGVTNSTLAGSTGNRYLTIAAVQSPFSLGQDQNDLHRVACNYQVEKERS